MISDVKCGSPQGKKWIERLNVWKTWRQNPPPTFNK